MSNQESHQPEAPEWEEGRYLTTLGDPLYSYGPNGILANPDLQVGFTATGLAAVFNGTGSIHSTAIYNLFFSFMLRRFEKRALSEIFNNLTLDGSKVIDTKPSPQQQIQSVNRYGLMFNQMFNYYAVKFLFFSAVVALHSLIIEDKNKVVFGFLSNATLISRLLSGMARMHNLKSGKWAIVDKPDPPPKHVAELARSPD